jgi:hypothetical protein
MQSLSGLKKIDQNKIKKKMGKRKKEHRRKVAARNQRIKTEQSAVQRLFNDAMKQQLEKLKELKEAEMSGDTETTL